MLSFQDFRSVLRCLCLLILTLSGTSLWAQQSRKASPGIAWRVRGPWRVKGKGALILIGDAIEPGSLLQPGEGTAGHSITVLLPDGQRVLYECFTAEDCARGFRVPSLYRTPEPFAVDMLARIHAVLVRENNDASTNHQKARLPQDELIAVLGVGNRVRVAGLAAKLSSGRYTYDLRPLDRAYPQQFHLVLEKRASSITFALPSSGLYVVTIADDLNTPRIDLFIAAVRPEQAASLRKSFLEAEALLKQWNGDYYGWPIHDFQRAYLESLVLDAKPPNTSSMTDVARQSAAPESRRHGVTGEPMFLPTPGLFDGDTTVTLRCATPGAAMHYTVDGSQPNTSSAVYGAPIMVKGTELTIKSFASAAGRKDSAVVTGIFRIRQ